MFLTGYLWVILKCFFTWSFLGGDKFSEDVRGCKKLEETTISLCISSTKEKSLTDCTSGLLFIFNIYLFCKFWTFTIYRRMPVFTKYTSYATLSKILFSTLWSFMRFLISATSHNTFACLFHVPKSKTVETLNNARDLKQNHTPSHINIYS